MQYAGEATITLLKWLSASLAAEEAIGVELPFLGGRHRSDVVVASPTRLSAIEVKAPKDDIRRLGSQLGGYREAFLDVSVATVPSNFDLVRQAVPEYAGLIVISESGVRIVRHPMKRSRLNKDAALTWLKSSELRLILAKRANPYRDTTITDMRDLARRKLTVFELSVAAVRSAYERILPRYERFLEERGDVITEDDLRTLTLPDRIG